MKNYIELLQKILLNGEQSVNRTGVDTIAIFGEQLKFDLADGFPAVTTKKLAFNAVKGELIGFLRGYSNASDFRKLGCNIWDDNANNPGINNSNAWLKSPYRKGTDDLGEIYGVTWRRWLPYELNQKPIDQVQVALDMIKNDPTSRRIIINGWRPDRFERMSLPPCHVMYQFNVSQQTKRLNVSMYQRSADAFLGLPFNIASTALLLSIFSKLTGYIPGTVTISLGDVHIYNTHLPQIGEQICRKPLYAPDLILSGFSTLEELEPHHIQLENYQYLDKLSAPMVV